MNALVGAFNQEKALVGAFSVIVKSSQTFVWSCTAQSFLSRLLLWTDAVILSVFNSADICAAAAQVPGPGPDWWRHSAFTRTQSSNISSVQPPALPGFCWQTFYTLVVCSILLRLWMQPKIAPKKKRSCFHLLAPAPAMINLHLAIAWTWKHISSQNINK